MYPSITSVEFLLARSCLHYAMMPPPPPMPFLRALTSRLLKLEYNDDRILQNTFSLPRDIVKNIIVKCVHYANRASNLYSIAEVLFTSRVTEKGQEQQNALCEWSNIIPKHYIQRELIDDFFFFKINICYRINSYIWMNWKKAYNKKIFNGSVKASSRRMSFLHLIRSIVGSFSHLVGDTVFPE